MDLGIDVLDGHWYATDPWPGYARLRREAPVWRDPKNELWVIAKHADVIEVSRHPERFCSGQGFRPKQPIVMPMMIGLDDPLHKQRRRLVSSGFTPRQVTKLEPHVREIVAELLDAIGPRGACDFTRDVAMPLPLLLIAELLGIRRDDAFQLQEWSDLMTHADVTNPQEPEALAFLAFDAYIREVIADRRRAPRDDLISVLAHAEVDGERLTDEDLVHESLLILVGGNETTRNVISGALEALLAHPDQMEALRREPQRLPTAIEEFLRWVTPIVNFKRTALVDTELRGQTIRAGDEVVLLYGSANRDEDVFADPDRFDIRRDPNPHVAFGFGPHFCMGASLARLEIRVLFEELLHRTATIELAGPVQRVDSAFIRGITSVPVAYTFG